MKVTLFLIATVALSAAELRFSIRSDPKTLEPLAVTDQISDTVRYLSTARLVRRNRVSQKLEPELAEKWEVRERGLVLYFRLRAGLKYSDGSPADSQDVKATLQRLLDPVQAYPVAAGLRTAGITAVETPGPLEVLIRLKASVAGLETIFEEIPILSSRSALKDRAALGPFTLKEYKRGAYLLFEKNPNYFRQSYPRADGVRIDIQGNPELERSRLLKGEIHLLESIDPDGFVALEKSGMAVDAGPTLDSEVLWFNQLASAPLPEFKKQWFRSADFRRAMSAALHREDFVRVAYNNRAIAGVGPIAPTSKEWFAPRLKAQPFDLKQVQLNLLHAGFHSKNGVLYDREGNQVAFSLLTNSGNRLRLKMASMIQQDLEKIGVKVQVVSLDMPSLLERMTRSSNYDAILLGFIGIDLDPNDQMNIWLSSSASHAWNPGQKQPETDWEAEIDALLKKQFHAPTLNQRKAYLHRFQAIVAEEAPMLFLVHPNALVAVSPELTGVRVSSLVPRVIWNIEELGISGPKQTAAK